jgi:hypothetical protein
MRSYTKEQIIFKDAVLTSTGTAFNVADFRHVVFSLAGSSITTGFTIKFQGSTQTDRPDFSAAQSPTNRWDYVQVRDYQNNTAIDGDTGVTLSANDVRQFECNTNGLQWICATITARTDGTANLLVTTYNN